MAANLEKLAVDWNKYKYVDLHTTNPVANNLGKYVDQAILSLDPTIIQNYDSLNNMFPNQSKDYLLSAAKIGLNASTKGIEKLSAHDGIAQLKQDLTNYDGIKNRSISDRSFSENLFGLFKGTSRALFATLQSPYQYVTSVGRDMYALSKGEIGVSKFIGTANIANVFGGENSNLGQLLRSTRDLVGNEGPVDTGSGYFINPKSEVGEAQARAMSAYGRINGKSFTIGRSTMHTLGADPNGTPYRVMSGILDATLAIGTDPSVWVGPGSVTKIIQGGKALKTGKDAAVSATKILDQEQTVAEIKEVKRLNKEMNKDIKKLTAGQESIRRVADNTLLKTEKKIQENAQSQAAAVSKRFEKALTFHVGRSSKIEGNPEVAALIEKNAIGDFVIKNIAEQKPEGLVNLFSQLDADYLNSSKAFTGIHFDEVPEAGKLSMGSLDGKEYVATVSKDNPLVINDISKTYENSTNAERLSEYAKREELFEQLYKFIEDPNIPSVTRQAIDDFIERTPTGKNAALKKQADNLVFGDGSESLAVLIARAASTKNEDLMQYVTQAIEMTYKVDGFTNVRAIFNGIGGTVITNSAKVGARQVEITDTLAGLVGKPAVASEISAKLIESIKVAQDDILSSSVALDTARKARSSVDEQVNVTNILRDYAAQDPDLIAKIINDPENIGISKLMDLSMDIASKGYKAEFIKSQVGLIDVFGGAAKGDVDKAGTYLLGKNFAVVAKVVAAETNFSRLHRLFGRKLDVEMTQQLVAATTPDEVISIFLKYLAAPTTDPKIYRSLALKGEVVKMSKKPIYKVVAPVVAFPLKLVEQTEKKFGRYFSRSVVLPLDDIDRLTNGLEDWMSSAKIPENIIDDTLNLLSKADTPELRGGVVSNAMIKTYETMAEQIIVKGEDLEEVKKIFYNTLVKVSKDNNLVKAYHTSKVGLDETVSLDGVFINGQLGTHSFGKEQAIFEYQFIDDVVRLPDTRDVYRMLNKYTKIKAIGGSKNALSVLNSEFGEAWRTAQLAFRIAYIIRNIGEMQFRQYFSGHDSLLNHPAQYIAMLAGDDKGGTVKKILSSFEKYKNDIVGNKLVGADAKLNQSASLAVEEHFNMLARNHNSGDARFAFVGKIFEVIGIDSDRYHLGLSNTLMRARTDKLLPIVAGTAKADEDKVVQELIAGTGKFKGVLETLINAGKNGVEKAEFATLFLKDSTFNKTTKTYNLAPENMIPENIKIYLFDANSSGSAASYVNNIVGTGSKAAAMRELLANGKVVIDGKEIKIPRYGELNNVNDMAGLESGFKSQLYKHFPKEEMPGSTVIGIRDKKFGAKELKFLNEQVDKFFDIATKIENVVNFAPEFRMSYWDHVGRYVTLVNDDALPELLINAQKALAPLTINGRSVSLKRHPSLRAINKEIAARKKGKSVTEGISLDTMNDMAATKAKDYTKNLFYDAARQRQTANAVRLIFPFAQAQFNTINKWRQLLWDSKGVQFYRLGRGYNALLQEDSNAIYDLTNTKYDASQGFFYKDEFGETRFRYPLAGNIIGALAGKNIDTAKALEITAPVQSLNLAFGAVNPVVPGIGPVGGLAYAATGKTKVFGPQWDAINSIVFPFGPPKSIQDVVFPAWFNKSFLGLINDDTANERGLKDWASYLASTGKYGDNPLADDASRDQLFADARGLSKSVNIMTAFFQSIAPATPSQDVFAKDKEGKLMAQTALYSAFSQISKNHPGDYFGAVGEYADTFGIKNLLVIQAGSTRNVRGTKDAWNFLNNNPEIAYKYVGGKGDIVPYFFPGGEGATAYYNFQKAAGGRRVLRPEELSQNAESLVYQMALSQVSNEQAIFGYSDVWKTQKVIELNQKFGGNAPVVSTDINVAEEKVSMIGKALEESAFRQSPNYKETKQFYDSFMEVYKVLQEVRTTPNPKLGGGGWFAQQEAKRLELLATQLMIENPAFAPMYYGVFSSLIKIRD